MTRRTGLPGDGRLSGLLDETAETGFSGLHEFGLAALEENGQEHIQLAFLVSGEQDPSHDRIHCIGAGRVRHISVSIGGEQIEMLGIAKQPGGRNTERAFVLEGMKPILELLQVNSPSLLAIVVTPTCLGKGGPSLQRALAQARPAVYTCREMVFETLSDVRTSPGMLAVLGQPEWDQAVIFKRPRLFGLYGECLQDPANV